MYRKEFESHSFLRTEKDVLDRIDFSSYDNQDELRRYFDEISGYSPVDLLNEIERIYTEVPIGKAATEKADLVKELFQVRIGLGFEIHYMIDMLQEEFQQIEKAFKEVSEMKKQFLNHRHALDKTYGEKPVW